MNEKGENFATAIELLQRSIAYDPFPDARYELLGRAVLGAWDNKKVERAALKAALPYAEKLAKADSTPALRAKGQQQYDQIHRA